MTERLNKDEIKDVFKTLEGACQGLFHAGQLRIAKDEIERAREAEKRLEYECVSGISRDTLKKLIKRKTNQNVLLMEKFKQLEKENAELKEKIERILNSIATMDL